MICFGGGICNVALNWHKSMVLSLSFGGHKMDFC